MTDAKIALLGGNRNGKTTFISALHFASLHSHGEWKADADDGLVPGSGEFLQKATDGLDQWELPSPNVGGVMTYALSLVGRSAGFLRRRPRVLTLVVEDPPGGNFLNITDASDPLWKKLAECSGFVLLIDPTKEIEVDNLKSFGAASRNAGNAGSNARRNFAYIHHLATHIRNAAGLPVGSALPQAVAVCVTKIDHQEVFNRLYGANLIEPEPEDGKFDANHPPIVSDAFSAFKHFVNDVTVEVIEESFDRGKTRYFALSSVGFHRDGASIRLSDTSNVTPDGKHLRSDCRPAGVLEPLDWLERQLSGRPAYLPF